MAMNFPSSPANGQVFYPPAGPIWIWSAAKGTWTRNSGTASQRNRVVNSSGMIDQQYATTAAVAVTGAGAILRADQWYVGLNVAGVTVDTYAGRIINPITLAGKPMSSMGFVGISNPTAITVAAGSAVYIQQPIEGSRVADLMWGTALGRYCYLRFLLQAEPGVYNVAIRNGATDRSWCRSFTMPDTNDFVEFCFVVPPDLSGTWIKDSSGAGMWLTFTGACGSNLINAAAEGAWVAGSYLGSATPVNCFAGAGSQFLVSSVGLYADPLMTGRPPVYQNDSYEDELRDCQRYWYRCYVARGSTNTGNNVLTYTTHPVPMRVAPGLAIVGTPKIYDGGTVATVTAVTSNACNQEVWGVQLQSTTALAGGGLPGGMIYSAAGSYMAVSARM